MSDILSQTIQDAQTLASEISLNSVKNSALEIVGIGKKFERELTPAQKAYEEARSELFSKYRGGPNADKLANALVTRRQELEEAIEKSPLKSAADRNGNSLGNLLELTNLAIDQAAGKMAGEKATLKRTVVTMANEEEFRINEKAEERTYEGLGTAMNRDQREQADLDARNLRSDFGTAKQQVKEFVDTLVK